MDTEWYEFCMLNLERFNILDALSEPDLILVAGEDGYEFPVHKKVIFSGSTYFEPNQYDMDKIHLENMPSEVLDLIITSIYGGTVTFTDFDLAKKVLDFAYLWDLKRLMGSASDYVYQNLTKSRCFDIYDHFDEHQPPVLRCLFEYVRVNPIYDINKT